MKVFRIYHDSMITVAGTSVLVSDKVFEIFTSAKELAIINIVPIECFDANSSVMRLTYHIFYTGDLSKETMSKINECYYQGGNL